MNCVGGGIREVTAAEFLEAVKDLPLSKTQLRKAQRTAAGEDGGYKEYLLVAPGTEMAVGEGRSYRGSGCYNADYGAFGNFVAKDFKPWDNGFASGESGTICLHPGSVVSYVAGDAIGNCRLFGHFIAACLPVGEEAAPSTGGATEHGSTHP